MKNNNPTYLMAAHDGTKKSLAQATGSNNSSTNMSTIADILIENVGRFGEQYRSDFIITWDYVRELLKTPVDETTRDIVVFAIRRQGVDSNNFLNCQLEDNAEWCREYYRKIYTLNIVRTADNSIECDLKDVTNEIVYSFKKHTPK